MEKNIPAWAQADIKNFRKSNTLGKDARRTPLTENDAVQAISSLASQIDQIVQLKDTEHDNCAGQKGVFQPKVDPNQFPMGPPIPAPKLKYSGNSKKGWTVTDMTQGPLQSLSVIIYSKNAIDSYVVLKTPLGSGSQLLHLDRNALDTSYNEISGGIWDMLGNLVQKWAKQSTPG